MGRRTDRNDALLITWFLRPHPSNGDTLKSGAIYSEIKLHQYAA